MDNKIFILGESMRFKLMALVIAVCFLVPGLLPAQTWSAVKQLTYTGGGAWDPAIAVDSVESVYLVFERIGSSFYDIFSKSSLAWGDIWLSPLRLSWTPGQSENPDIAVDSIRRQHVVWVDYNPSPAENTEIMYKHKAYTALWSPTIRVTWTVSGSSSPAIAVDSNDTVHIVWTECIIENREIYYKKTTDCGNTWTPTKRLTWNPGGSSNPAIAIDSNDNIHVVWANGVGTNSLIYHKVSTDGGNTWSTVNRLSVPVSGFMKPDIAADQSGGVHVVWSHPFSGKTDVLYRRSTNGGTTWQISQRLTWSTGYTGAPKIDIGPLGGIHVVYADNSPGNLDIFYKESTDGGTTWLPMARLTWNDSESEHPQIAVDKNNSVHIVWWNATGGESLFEIYYKKRASAPLI